MTSVTPETPETPDLCCHFLPPYVTSRLQNNTQAIDDRLRAARATATPSPAGPGAKDWEVHDAQNGSELPGELVRSAGEPESGDVAVDEAATGVARTLELYRDLGRDSYDDQGATVVASVHYEKDYDNAFWDGTQLVFGDGDGTIFERFTKPIDVLAHELTHAVTQFTANLTYQGQSGALNESVSDVFGACVKQRESGRTAEDATWLVGEGIFKPGINGRALRSMKEPGTAYDDPQLGKDPQPGHLDDYVETTDDNGGVHINSGIPNRAFVLAAIAIGGITWEGAGKIWYAALTSGLSADSDFATFAQATVDAAGDHAEAVRKAWQEVGVTPGTSAAEPTPAPAGGAGADTVAVTRTGGVAGLTRQGSLDLGSDDPRAGEARSLVDRIDFGQVAGGGSPQPDRFVYDFDCRGQQCTVPEPDLTPDLARLARLVLD